MTQTKLRVRTWVALVIIVALGGPSVINTVGEWRSAQTIGQRVVTVVEGSFSLAGFLGVIAVISRSAWARPLILMWAVLITLTAGLAPYHWGGSSVPAALVSGVFGGLIATVIAMLVLPSRLNPS
jgi:hypothetical protein